MTRVAVILGSRPPANGDGPRMVPASDRAAVGLAISRFGAHAIAFSIEPDETAARYAIAAGAANATLLGDLESLAFDVAILGGAGCGHWGDVLPAMLAQLHHAAMVLDVTDIEIASTEPLVLRVTRDLGRGASEVLRVSGRAVLVIAERAPRVDYVSHYRLHRAATPGFAGSTGLPDPLAAAASPWQPARIRTKTANLGQKTGGTATDRMNSLVGAQSVAKADDEHIITADPATCAKHLLRYLAHHGFVDREVDPAPTGMDKAIAKQTEPASASTAQSLPESPRRWNIRLRRGPRSLTGAAPGVHRRPRPLEPVYSLGKLTRIPRPLGSAAPRAVRGPYPLKGSTTHG